MDEATHKQRQTVVIEQCNGILPYCEAFYIHSVLYAADRSLDAFLRFDNAVANSKPPALIVATVQEALTHAGGLSRFFWPGGRQPSELTLARCKRLREAFQLDENSPLKWRKLRDWFEHFDEKLDTYLLQDLVGTVYPQPLVGDYAGSLEPNYHPFKLVDPKQSICVLLGQKFEFQPIRTEVNRILELALKMDSQGCRLT